MSTRRFPGFLTAFACAAVLALHSGPAHAGTSSVVINEVDCRGNDWVELVNRSSAPVDISGWALSDKAPIVASGPHLYLFPHSSVIPAHGFLVVQQTGVGNQQLTFGVPCSGGQSVFFSQPTTPTTFELVNRVPIPLMPARATYGRLPNGSGPFQFTSPTKGKSNTSALPSFVGSTALTCGVKKVCTYRLKATNAAVFQTAKKVMGVSVSVQGVMKFAAHGRGVYAIPLRLMNPSGTKITTISVRVK